MDPRAAVPDSRTAWITAVAALAILTVAYGAPLISVVALKPIAADLGTSRARPAAVGRLHLYRRGVRRHRGRLVVGPARRPRRSCCSAP